MDLENNHKPTPLLSGKIRQKKIRSLLRKFKLATTDDFRGLRPTCYRPNNGDYHTHVKTFRVNGHIQDVWKAYTGVPTSGIWNGDMVSFGFMYNRTLNQFSYRGDTDNGMQAGQVVFLNIRLLWGFFNIAVAHEVMEVNEIEKTIKICYLENATSEGSQEILFSETTDDETLITHKTLYRSKSEFRDTKMYPRVHEKAISEFHSNIAAFFLDPVSQKAHDPII